MSTVDVKTVTPTFNNLALTALIEDIGFSSECNFFFMNKVLLFHFIGRFDYVGQVRAVLFCSKLYEL
jgi:hypothetical protein